MKQDKKSYSEAMNDWQLQEAQRSFMGKFRSSIFHPRYDASWWEKLIGYFYRLVIVVVATSIGLYIYARVQSKTKAYRGYLAETFSNYYQGTNAKIGPIAWPLFNNNISFKTFTMDGQEGVFFHKIDATAVALALGTQFVSDTWHFDKMHIHELRVDLKSGGLGERPAGPGASEAAPGTTTPSRVVVPERSTSAAPMASLPQLLTAGFALRPDAKKLSIDAYYINALTCKWGNSETNAGVIEDASTILAKSPKEESKWIMSCSSGKFSQNWIKNASIEKFQSEISPSGAEIIAGTSLRVGEHGQLFLRGNIAAGDLPKVDLDVTLKNVDLRNLCPQELQKFFMATVSGQGKITGTTNNQSGVKMEIKVNLVTPARAKMDDRAKEGDEAAKLVATLTEIPILKALHLSTQERGFMKMRFTEGSFTLATGEGRLAIQNMDLVSPIGRIRGEVRCESEIQVSGGGQLGETLSSRKYIFSGDILIGISPAVGKQMPQIVRDSFIIQQTADGLEWIKVSFTGDRSGSVTGSAASEMERLLRLSWEQPAKVVK